jgi:hypothetical protein
MADRLYEADAHSLEINAIRFYGRKDLGTGILHNRCDGGGSNSGYKRSTEAIEKTAAARKGWKPSPEARAKMRDAHKGKKLSAEHKAKIGAASAGNRHNLGMKLSPESIAKREATKRANRLVHGSKLKSAETRARISAALKNKPLSPDHIAKREATKRANRIAATHHELNFPEVAKAA